MDVKLALSEDRQSVRGHFGDQPASLGTPALEALIAYLGRRRALMLPAVPQDESNSAGTATEDPRWELIPAGGDHPDHDFLSFRDPRFGWVDFAFTPEELRGLAAALCAVIQTR